MPNSMAVRKKMLYKGKKEMSMGKEMSEHCSGSLGRKRMVKQTKKGK